MVAEKSHPGVREVACASSVTKYRYLPGSALCERGSVEMHAHECACNTTLEGNSSDTFKPAQRAQPPLIEARKGNTTGYYAGHGIWNT